MTRPRIEMTGALYAQAAALARIGCTAAEVALVLGMSPKTLDRRLKERGYAG